MKLSIVIVFCFFSLFIKAQNNFVRNLSIPLIHNSAIDFPWAGGVNFPSFSEIDLNNDGLNDLFVFDRSYSRVLTFLNNGTSGIHCWNYAPEYADLFPALRDWALLYDYNCDNKPDLFCPNFSNNGISQYRNDSQSGNIVFTLVDSSVGYYFSGSFIPNVFASGFLEPNLNDIDGDGDMDIISHQFQCAGGYAYYKNMSLEHYGNCDSIDDFVFETNTWGKFILRSGFYENVVVGFWNVNCFQISDPEFSYEIARRDDTYANIFTIDIDGDGDKDAIVGDSGARNSLLVVNGGNNTLATMTSQDTLFPSYDLPVKIHTFAVHSFVDVDNDGVKDLIVSQREYENNNGVYFYKNTGTNQVPVFSHVMNNFLQNEMVDVGESAAPVFFDFNGDGLMDIVIGNKIKTTSDSTYVTSLTLYKNTGTLSSPAFEIETDDYAGIISLNLTGQIFPAFGDLDGDLDVDMILGLDNGGLLYFMNMAGPGVEAAFTTPVYGYMSIDVGQASTPKLYDLNKDGALDLVIGNKNGLVKYYENLGTSTGPFFPSVPTNDTLGNIRVNTTGSPDGYSVPFVFEFNGETRMLVSCMKGDIYLFGNIDSNLTGNFNLLDTVLKKSAGSRYGYNLSVSGGDINNDSFVDMLIGMYGGGMQIYYQDIDNSISTSADDFENLIQIYPNPAQEKLLINSKTNSEIISCVLFDITGRKVLNQSIQDRFATINVSSISTGAYFIQITFAKTVVTGKVLVQR